MGRDGQYRRGDDISDFPIEEARLAGAYALVAVSAVSTMGYGVSLMERTVREFSMGSSAVSLGVWQDEANHDWYAPAHIRSLSHAVCQWSSHLKHIHGTLPSFASSCGVQHKMPDGVVQLCGTLLTDLNPHASATVQASYNIIRCIGAGAAIASQQPLADAAGLGWCFGIFAIIMLSAGPLVMLLKRRGMEWRRESSEAVAVAAGGQVSTLKS